MYRLLLRRRAWSDVLLGSSTDSDDTVEERVRLGVVEASADLLSSYGLLSWSA